MEKCNTCQFIGREFGLGKTDHCTDSRSLRAGEFVWDKPACSYYRKYFCPVHTSQQAADAKKAGL